MTHKLTNVKKEETGFYSSREGYLLKLKFCHEHAYNEDVEVSSLSSQFGNKALFKKSNKTYDIEAIYKKLWDK